MSKLPGKRIRRYYERVEAETYQVEVRLDGGQFLIVLLDETNHIESDPTLEGAEKKMKKYLLDQADTKWEEWLDISAKRDQTMWVDGGNKVEISYVIWENGTSKRGEHSCRRKQERTSIYRDWVQERINRDPYHSYIPATPMNVAAINDLIKRLGMIGDKVADFLSQKKIQHSLSQVQNLLPEPEGEKK